MFPSVGKVHFACTHMLILLTCPFYTNGGCGKERRILTGPW